MSRYGAGGSHTVVLRVTTKDKRLRTGLACAVEMPKASNEEVLSVPKSALHKAKDGVYVFVKDTDGEATKTKVEIGDSAAGRVEITSGLKAGQKVLKTPPAAKEDEKK